MSALSPEKHGQLEELFERDSDGRYRPEEQLDDTGQNVIRCQFVQNDRKDGFREVMEVYKVDEGLYEELKDRGEPVAELGHSFFWGRTTTGQSIAEDYVIRDIYDIHPDE